MTITLCSDDAASDRAQFLRAVTPYLRISRIEFAARCPADPEEGLCAAFSRYGDAVHLAINGTIADERIHNHHRLLPWLSDIQKPLRHTLSAEKPVAFGLLLETLLMDLEQIRLRFKRAEVRPPKAETSQETGTPRGNEDGQPGDAMPPSDPQPAPARSRAPQVADEKPTPPAAPPHRPYRIALGAGALFLSPDVWGPSVNLYAARRFNRLGVFLAADVEPSSSFHLGDRTFRTVLFGGRVGCLVSLLQRQRIGLSLGISLLTRINRFKRSQYASAKWRTWADVGAGVHLSLGVAPWERVGFLLAVGIDIYPTARNVGVKEGPKKKVGLIGVPAGAGVFVKF